MQPAVTKFSIDRADQARFEYELGLAFFRKKQWKSAARHFAIAEQKTGRVEAGKQVYLSYHGLSLVCGGDVSGLNLCRYAARVERADAMVFRNLVLAEMWLRHRKRACAALVAGLAINANHSDLLKLRRKLGVRRRPCIPFLQRSNWLNKWLGKATYRGRDSAVAFR